MLKWAVIRAFARPYIKKKSKLPPEELKQKTVAMLQKFLDRTESLSAEQLEQAPDSGGWSAGEIVFHAIQSAKGMFSICEGLRKEDAVPELTRERIGKTKKIAREDLIDFCRKIREAAGNFDYTGNSKAKSLHGLLGEFNFREWLALNVIHLQRHYDQLLRATPTSA